MDTPGFKPFTIYCHCLKNVLFELSYLDKFVVFFTGVTKCQKEYLDATSGPPLLGRFVPTCRADGSYAPVQCHGSTGFCWCVTKDGKEIPNTRIRGRPKCMYFYIALQ